MKVFSLFKTFFKGGESIIFLCLFALHFFSFSLYAATYTITPGLASGGTYNWSAAGTWVGGAAPSLATDNVVFQCTAGGSGTITLNVDVTATIANLTIGSASATRCYIQVASTKTLTINGVIAPNNNGDRIRIYSGAGTLTVSNSATLNLTNLTGGNSCRFYASSGTGILNYYPAINITNNQLGFGSSASGATFNFYNDVTNGQNTIVMSSGGNINFYGNYTVNTTNTSTGNWSSGSNATFYGASKTITPTTTVYFGNLTVANGASTTIAAGAGTVTAQGAVTLASTSALTLSHDIYVKGNWTNSGGTLTAVSSINVYLTASSSTARTISGTTTFPNLHIGKPNSGDSWSITYNMSTNNSCNNFTIEDNSSTGTSRPYVLNHTGSAILTVGGSATIKQQNYTGATTTTNSWNISAGSSTVAVDLVFSNGAAGSNNTTTSIAQVAVSTGTLTVTGNVTWLAQTGTAAVATEVISVTTGTLTFVNSINMPRGSGTLKVSSTGTINFNGTTAPSLNLNANGIGTTNAILTTTSGCTLNFVKGFTNTNNAVTIAAGSFSIFTGTGTVTPTAAITFGNITIGATYTVTLAGNIDLKNNWLNNGGTLTGNYTVTFDGAAATQTITKTGGETFYSLTANVAGSTMQMNSDVTVTNTLNLSGHNFNLNGYTLQLGSGAANTLTIAGVTTTAGFCYGGTFKRYWPTGLAAGGISPSVAPLYGLFPIGISGDYRPVSITSTIAPTGAGYISAIHNNSAGVIDLTSPYFTDNEGSVIQRISSENSTLSNSGVGGGKYNIDVTFNGFDNNGGAAVYSDYRLETYTGAVMGFTPAIVLPEAATTAATTITTSNPVLHRTGLLITDIPNVFVCGTKTPATTPIQKVYYSLSTVAQPMNWNVNSNWSLIGPTAASCTCTPSATGYVVVSSTTTVNVNAGASTGRVDIRTGGKLQGTSNLTTTDFLITAGTGIIAPTGGTWSIGGDMTLAGTGTSTFGGTGLTVTGALSVGSNTSLTSTANITVHSDIMVDGTLGLSAGASALTLDGTNKQIGGTGTVSGTGTVVITNNKSVIAAATLTISPTFSLSAATTLTNSGSPSFITNATSVTGANAATSIWTQDINSTVNAAGAFLSTGTLNASNSGNTVNYNGAGSQTIKTPASSYYDLICSTSGTKSLSAAVTVDNEVNIKGAAVLDEGTNILSGAADLTMTSGTSPELRLSRNASTTVPELTGVYTLTTGTISLNETGGSGNVATLNAGPYYDLKLNDVATYTSATGTYDLGNVSNINNDFYISGAAIWDNTGGNDLSVTRNTYYSSTGTSTLKGNFTTATYTVNAGTFNDGGFVTTITGSGWTNNGGTFTTTGEVVFNGTTAQTIGGSNSTTFYDLTINNTSGAGAGVTLSKNTTVTNILNLASGIVNTGANTLILSNTTDANLLYDNTLGSLTFVYGTLRRYIASNTSIYDFPVGDGTGTTDRHIISFINNSITGVSYLDASVADFIQVDPNDDASLTTTQTTTPILSTAGEATGHTDIWTLTPDAVPTGGNYGVRLSVENTNLSGSDDDMFCPLKRNNTASYANFLTYDATTSIPPSGTAGRVYNSGNGYAERTGYTSFSQHIIGKGTKALPVELLMFEAKPDGNIVNVQWLTATEFNSDYFVVQHSKDGINFSDVVQKKAAGNSSTTRKYSAEDYEPYNDISYYRLKQVDFDGKFSYSDVVAVQLHNEDAISVYPNPSAKDQPFNVSISGQNGKDVLVVVRDVQGKEYFSKVNLIANDIEVIAIDPSEKLAAGLYLVVATSNDTIYEKKIMIK